MNLQKKCTAKPNSLSVIDAPFASDNLHVSGRTFQKEYDISRGAAKISALSSGKIDKYEYLKDEEILHFD